METILNTLLQALINLVPFTIALVVLVIGNTIAGAIQHTNDFSWKELLNGALKWLGILVCILCMLIAITLYDPLAQKYATEFEVLQEALIFAYFLKVCVQVYKITGVKKSKTLETSEDETEVDDSEAIG